MSPAAFSRARSKTPRPDHVPHEFNKPGDGSPSQKNMLSDRQICPFSDIALFAGFSSLSYFSARFSRAANVA
jgi:AraC-like DNA-binding protein